MRRLRFTEAKCLAELFRICWEVLFPGSNLGLSLTGSLSRIPQKKKKKKDPPGLVLTRGHQVRSQHLIQQG